MNTKDVLIAARKKIERPECWTRGVYARNDNGEVVNKRSGDAVCWCAFGAIFSAAPLDFYSAGKCAEVAFALDMALIERPDGVGVAEFNDDPATTHTDVLALFDRAIAACKEE